MKWSFMSSVVWESTTLVNTKRFIRQLYIQSMLVKPDHTCQSDQLNCQLVMPMFEFTYWVMFRINQQTDQSVRTDWLEEQFAPFFLKQKQERKLKLEPSPKHWSLFCTRPSLLLLYLLFIIKYIQTNIVPR